MKALLIVHLQNDFMPSGAVGIPDAMRTEAQRVVARINALQLQFDYVVASQIWHSAEHQTFVHRHPGRLVGDLVELDSAHQPLRPAHCVQGTRGAAFADGLDTRRVAEVFRSGTDPHVAVRSAFFDSGKKHSTGLDRHLSKRGVKDVYVVGVPVEHGVRTSAIDSSVAGFRTHIITDACLGYERAVGDMDAAFHEAKRTGAKLTTCSVFL